MDFTSDSLDLLEAEIGELSGRLRDVAARAGKLDQHREALRSLRPSTRLPSRMPRRSARGRAGGSASVEKLRPALQGNAKDAYKHALFSDIFDAQVDIMARALVSGLTRVATLQAGSADGNAIVPVDRGYPHHNTSHGNQTIFSQCQRWYMTKLERLLAALDVPDPLDPGGKTVLYNTAMVVMAECLPVSHGSESVPTFVVGNAGGRCGRGLSSPDRHHQQERAGDHPADLRGSGRAALRVDHPGGAAGMSERAAFCLIGRAGGRWAATARWWAGSPPGGRPPGPKARRRHGRRTGMAST